MFFSPRNRFIVFTLCLKYLVFLEFLFYHNFKITHLLSNELLHLLRLKENCNEGRK